MYKRQVLNTPVEVIEQACQEASQLGVVTPANYNTPSQIVIGGEVVAVDRAVAVSYTHLAMDPSMMGGY